MHTFLSVWVLGSASRCLRRLATTEYLQATEATVEHLHSAAREGCSPGLFERSRAYQQLLGKPCEVVILTSLPAPRSRERE